jgi:hypothetical protein
MDVRRPPWIGGAVNPLAPQRRIVGMQRVYGDALDARVSGIDQGIVDLVGDTQ